MEGLSLFFFFRRYPPPCAPDFFCGPKTHLWNRLIVGHTPISGFDPQISTFPRAPDRDTGTFLFMARDRDGTPQRPAGASHEECLFT